MMGVGSVYFTNAIGEPLTTGVLYSYVAGTTTQQATFTDSTGLTQNPNPVPFDATGRASIWLTNTAFYKFVWCAANDGSACASGDVLAVSDQVPGSPVASSSASTFTGTFISGTTNPATSGILRLASIDSACWRNASSSANLCWTLDSNNLLSWGAGSFKEPFVAGPVCLAGFSEIWADSGATRWKVCNNAGTAAQLVDSGIDINTSDQVTSTHLAAPLPLAQGGTGSATLTGLQGTDTLLQTAGTVAASQPIVCTDANGGTTTTGCPSVFDTNGGTTTSAGTCPTAGTAYAMCSVTVPLFRTEANTSYAATCTVVAAAAGNPWVYQIASKTTTNIVVTISNLSGALATASTPAEVDCVITR
jgi:hypothetical protein